MFHRFFFTLIGGMLLGVVVYANLVQRNIPVPFLPVGHSVLGARIEGNGDTNTSINASVMQIKDQVSHLNVSEIASSSPQVQKVLKDIQDLQSYPKKQAKQACLNICDQLQ